MALIERTCAGCSGSWKTRETSRATHCPECYKVEHPKVVRKAKTKKRAALLLAPPCSYRGKPTGKTSTCQSCTGTREVELLGCSKFNEPCFTGSYTPLVGRSCMKCEVPKEEAQLRSLPMSKPLETARVDALPPLKRTVIKGLRGHFNAGIDSEPDGTYLLASRDRLHGARVYLTRLDADFQPTTTPSPLALGRWDCQSGQIDPRIHRWRGRRYICFAGIHSKGSHEHQGQFYAEVNEAADGTWEVGPTHRPRFEDWKTQKNWGFFEGQEGEHLAVYSIAPHVILNIDGEIAQEAHRTENPFAWSGGELRGGAPPVRVGDEYVVWFHGCVGRYGKGLIYNVGVYAFEAKPPYKVTRQTITPLLWATELDRQPNHGCRVIFPQGAVLKDGKWLVSMGAGDQRIEVCEWDAAEVDALLVREAA